MVLLVNLPQKVNQESKGGSTFTTQSMFFITLAVNLKTHVISLDAEKAFSKIQYPFVGKRFWQTRTRREHHYSENGYQLKTYSNHITREMLKAFSEIGKETVVLFSSNTVLEVPASGIREREE